MSVIRVAALSGATGAIGEAIAGRLARLQGWKLVLLCRDSTRSEALVGRLRRETDNPDIESRILDLSRPSAIEELRRSWDGPLQVLVNNAAAVPKRRESTPEGIESTAPS